MSPVPRLLLSALLCASFWWHGACQLFDSSTNTLFFQPLSTQTIDTKVNDNQPSKLTTAVIQVSNLMDQGTFFADSFKVQIASEAPAWNYRYKEVGRIPKAVYSQSVKVCMVADPTAFGEAAAAQQITNYATDLILYQIQQDAQSATSSASRRLLTDYSLIFDPFDINKANAIENLQNDVGRLKDQLNGVSNKVTNVTNRMNIAELTIADQQEQLDEILSWSKTTAGQINTIGGDVDKQKQMLEDIRKSFRFMNASIHSTTTAIDAMGRVAAENLKRQSDYFASELSNMNTALTSQIGSMHGFINSLAVQNANLVKQIIDTVQRLDGNILDLDRSIEDIGALLFYELTQSSLKKAITKAYFEIAKTLPRVLSPMITDPGTPPANDGQLIGEQKRILLERFYIMFSTPETVGAPRLRTVQLSWFVSSDHLIDNMANTLSLKGLYRLFAVPLCTAPFLTPITPHQWRDGTSQDPLQSDSEFECRSWVEVEETSCISATFGEFWSVSDHVDTPFISQENGRCAAAATKVFRLLRTHDQLESYLVNSTCRPNRPLVPAGLTTTDADGYFMGTERTRMLSRVEQPTEVSGVCTRPPVTQINERATVLGRVLSTALIAYPFMRLDVMRVEQLKYGRLPGGLTYEQLPFDHIPPMGNDTNTGTYAPRMCHRVTFNLAHVDTVPVHAIYPDPSALVSKAVQRHVSLSDPATHLDYTNGLHLDQTVVFSDNILLVDNAQHLLPKSTLMVGDIDDPLYIYDAPDRLIDVTSNIHARKNTVSYYLMPPGTKKTWDLPRFQRQYASLHDATQGALGPNLFAVPVARDYAGSPVCNVGSGLPSPFMMTGVTNGRPRTCADPEKRWENNTAMTSTLASVCGAHLSTLNPIKLYNQLEDLLQTTQAMGVDIPAAWIQPGTGFAVSFLYEGIATVNVMSLDLQNGMQISVTMDFTLGIVAVRLTQTAQPPVLISSSRSGLFGGRKHAILVIFTGEFSPMVGEVAGWHCGIVIDGFLDKWTPVTMPTVVMGATWSPPSTEVRGVEAVYGMEWPTGATGAELFNPVAVEHLRLCSYAVAENHCRITTGPETIVFASPSNAVTEQIVCPVGGTLVYRSHTIDGPSPVSSPPSSPVFTSAGEFTLTWWAHASLSTKALAGAGNLVLFTLASGSFSVSVYHHSVTGGLVVVLTSGSDTQTLNGLAASQLSATVTPAKFALKVANGRVILVNNLISEVNTTLTIPFSGTGLGFTLSYVSEFVAVSSIRLYSYSLMTTALAAEVACDSGLSYVIPTGYCRWNAASTTTGFYCRSPAICNGNCETYAVYNAPKKQFANVGSNQCDDGFLPPDCKSPCPHPDPITRVCLTDEFNSTTASGSSSTLVPGGTWCDVLKHYRVSLSPLKNKLDGTQRLALSPRQYIMQVSVPIPSGKITSVIQTGAACPLVEFVGQASTATLVLSNPSPTDIQVRVNWGLPPGCVHQAESVRSIKGFFPAYFPVPACGNFSLSIYTLAPDTQFVLCRNIDSFNAASALETASAAVSTTLATSITVADTALQMAISVNEATLGMLVTFMRASGVDLAAYNSLYQNALQLIQNTSKPLPGSNFSFSVRPVVPDTFCDQQCQDALADARDNANRAALLKALDDYNSTFVNIAGVVFSNKNISKIIQDQLNSQGSGSGSGSATPSPGTTAKVGASLSDLFTADGIGFFIIMYIACGVPTMLATLAFASCCTNKGESGEYTEADTQEEDDTGGVTASKL